MMHHEQSGRDPDVSNQSTPSLTACALHKHEKSLSTADKGTNDSAPKVKHRSSKYKIIEVPPRRKLGEGRAYPFPLNASSSSNHVMHQQPQLHHMAPPAPVSAHYYYQDPQRGSAFSSPWLSQPTMPYAAPVHPYGAQYQTPQYVQPPQYSMQQYQPQQQQQPPLPQYQPPQAVPYQQQEPSSWPAQTTYLPRHSSIAPQAPPKSAAQRSSSGQTLAPRQPSLLPKFASAPALRAGTPSAKAEGPKKRDLNFLLGLQGSKLRSATPAVNATASATHNLERPLKRQKSPTEAARPQAAASPSVEPAAATAPVLPLQARARLPSVLPPFSASRLSGSAPRSLTRTPSQPLPPHPFVTDTSANEPSTSITPVAKQEPPDIFTVPATQPSAIDAKPSITAPAVMRSPDAFTNAVEPLAIKVDPEIIATEQSDFAIDPRLETQESSKIHPELAKIQAAVRRGKSSEPRAARVPPSKLYLDFDDDSDVSEYVPPSNHVADVVEDSNTDDIEHQYDSPERADIVPQQAAMKPEALTPYRMPPPMPLNYYTPPSAPARHTDVVSKGEPSFPASSGTPIKLEDETLTIYGSTSNGTPDSIILTPDGRLPCGKTLYINGHKLRMKAGRFPPAVGPDGTIIHRVKGRPRKTKPEEAELQANESVEHAAPTREQIEFEKLYAADQERRKLAYMEALQQRSWQHQMQLQAKERESILAQHEQFAQQGHQQHFALSQEQQQYAFEQEQRRLALEQETLKLAYEEGQRKQAALEEQLRQQVQEQERLQAAADEEARRQFAEEEQRRKAAEEQERQKTAAEEEQRRKAHEEEQQQQQRNYEQEQLANAAAEKKQEKRAAKLAKQRQSELDEDVKPKLRKREHREHTAKSKSLKGTSKRRQEKASTAGGTDRVPPKAKDLPIRSTRNNRVDYTLDTDDLLWEDDFEEVASTKVDPTKLASSSAVAAPNVKRSKSASITKENLALAADPDPLSEDVKEGLLIVEKARDKVAVWITTLASQNHDDITMMGPDWTESPIRLDSPTGTSEYAGSEGATAPAELEGADNPKTYKRTDRALSKARQTKVKPRKVKSSMAKTTKPKRSTTKVRKTKATLPKAEESTPPPPAPAAKTTPSPVKTRQATPSPVKSKKATPSQTKASKATPSPSKPITGTLVPVKTEVMTPTKVSKTKTLSPSKLAALNGEEDASSSDDDDDSDVEVLGFFGKFGRITDESSSDEDQNLDARKATSETSANEYYEPDFHAASELARAKTTVHDDEYFFSD